MPRKLVANSHIEAYDLWASEFDDPALMANRDAATTRRKLARVAESLALDPSSRVLDVGPGDGALFRHIIPSWLAISGSKSLSFSTVISPCNARRFRLPGPGPVKEPWP